MKFPVGGSTRGGAVSVRIGDKDGQDEHYNLDPGSGIYQPVKRRLSRGAPGQLSALLETSSEFLRFTDNNKQCEGITFKSEGTVGLPANLSMTGIAVVEDNIRMGLRFEKGMKIRLQATVLADLDIVEIELQGPQFKTPLRVLDEYDKGIDITEAGVYLLKGSYQLTVRLPNTGLGGRDIKVEMQATLSGA